VLTRLTGLEGDLRLAKQELSAYPVVSALATGVAQMSLSRKSLSPEKPLGAVIDMSVEGVLNYCRGKQHNSLSLNLDMMCHTKNDPAMFALSGRSLALERIQQVMSSEEAVNDRIKHPIMVCCGLSGLGKTRMLEEWDMYWERARVTGTRVAVLVLYENGHGLRTLDGTIGWEASVAWRFLHRVFLEDNMDGVLFDEWFRKDLPANASHLTMSLALHVLRKAMVDNKQLNEAHELTVFVGIDEFQKIAHFDELLPALAKCTSLPGFKVHFMMAGLEWGPLSIARSSNVFTTRIPVSLLDTRSSEAMLASNEKSRVLLSSIICRRHVFLLGGVPRFVEQYAKYVLGEKFEKPPNLLDDQTALGRAVAHVFENFVDRAWVFPELRHQLKLIAYALSRKAVKPGAKPGIAIGMKHGREIIYPEDLTWQQLSDTGVCLLVERNTEHYVNIPHCVFPSASAFGNDLTFSEKLFYRTIVNLREEVDNHLFALEPWQLWERFGACFHALRINALLVAANVNEMICQMDEVFAGSRMGRGLGESSVLLRPMDIMFTSEKFSEDLPLEIKSSLSKNHFKWIKDVDLDTKLPFSRVVMNGSNGKGVDIFFALEKANHPGYYLVTDQRKRVAVNSISENLLRGLVAKANVIPRCIDAPCEVVTGVFNVFPQTLPALPPNCFLVGANETESYHGCLALHPASDPRVYVNSDHESALALIDGVSSNTAKKIVERREKQLFMDRDEFLTWLREECKVELSADQKARLVVS
jgi:hypothetical protein